MIDNEEYNNQMVVYRFDAESILIGVTDSSNNAMDITGYEPSVYISSDPAGSLYWSSTYNSIDASNGLVGFYMPYKDLSINNDDQSYIWGVIMSNGSNTITCGEADLDILKSNYQG